MTLWLVCSMHAPRALTSARVFHVALIAVALGLHTLQASAIGCISTISAVMGGAVLAVRTPAVARALGLDPGC